MGAPFTTTRGYVRERVLEELYRRPGEYLSTQQLTALIDEADTSAEIASICFDLKRTQRLCTGQKVIGANGIPANTWGLSDGERADLERRRPDLAALMAPKGKGQASGAKAKGNGKGQDPTSTKGAKGKAAKGAGVEVANVKQGLTTAGSVKPAEAETIATPAPAVVLAAADLDALGLPAAAPVDDPLPLPTESQEDERPIPAQAKTGCGGHGGCGGHCANHERNSQAESGRDDLRAQLDSRNILVAEQQTRIDDLLTERVKLFDELAAKDRDLKNALQDNAALESFRDSFLGILEERDARLAEAQRRIDALMLAVRPHLGAGTGAGIDRGQARALATRDAGDRDATPGTTPREDAPVAPAPTWHVNLATEPFGLPTVPKDWHGELKLRLLDDSTQMTFRVDSEGAGAYWQLKSNAIFDHSEADFVAPLMNGLIQIMDHLFPHLTASYPNATPTEARA